MAGVGDMLVKLIVPKDILMMNRILSTPTAIVTAECVADCMTKSAVAQLIGGYGEQNERRSTMPINRDDLEQGDSPITPPEGDIEERELFEPAPAL